MTQILDTPLKLNLLLSALAAVGGLAIYWLWRPRIFQDHPFAESAFEFWILRWMLVVITWGLVAASIDTRFVLAALDLNTVLGLGLVLALWKGDSYAARPGLVNLVFCYGLLLSWNFVVNPLIGSGKVWLYPSRTASLLVIALMAYVVVERCGSQAIMFVLASGLYLFLQLPSYDSIFLNGHPQLVQWLGFAKLFYSGLFYTVFPWSLKSFTPLHVPRLPVTNDKLRHTATWVMATVGGGLLTEFSLWLFKFIGQVLAAHHGA